MQQAAGSDYNFVDMSKGHIKLKRALAAIYLALIHALALAFLLNKFVLPAITLTETTRRAVSDPTEYAAVPTPLPVPSEFYEPPANVESKSEPASTGEPNENAGDGLKLIIPVVGVKSEQLQDTFTAARSEGRVHEAIDIMAPAGTPVVAAADGRIVKFFDSAKGGITIYQLSADEKYVYYYAHLQKRAEGLSVGDVIRQGMTIGFAGDTGNAGTGNFHLHFSLFAVTDPKRYWDGTNINPYPLLKADAR